MQSPLSLYKNTSIIVHPRNLRSAVCTLDRVSEGVSEIPVVLCPLCRCVVHPSDIAHVQDYLISSASESKVMHLSKQ